MFSFMRPRFNIIIPMFNVADDIGKNIAMLQAQSYSNFTCTLIDDLSTDNTISAVEQAVGSDSRFRFVVNTQKKYAIRNAVDAISERAAGSSDIIVPVDGDDQLEHPEVLAHVAAVYADSNCWLTYGSYINEHGERGRECSAYPESVVATSAYRRHRWHASHLKTFRADLWHHVGPEALKATAEELRRVKLHAFMHGDLRTWYHWRSVTINDLLDPSGQCFRRCYDKAIMFPMLELSGEHAHFMPEVLYRYCSSRAKSSPRASETKWQTRCIQQILRDKPPLQPLASLK
jgi:glycosyltransferase involved in cell wall biosynthesis